MVDKEILKELLFSHIFETIKNESSDVVNSEYFRFAYSEDKKSITFSTVIEVVGGASCWEEDIQTTEPTTMKFFAEYQIGELLEDFIYQESDLKQQGMGEEKISEYHMTKKDPYDFYYYSENENVNEDYYYNHDVVRTLTIPVEEMANYLSEFPFTKPLEELQKSLRTIPLEKFNAIVAQQVKPEIKKLKL